MPDSPDPKQTGPSSAAAWTETRSHVVSRERFDSVPRRRAYYIALYLITFVLWLYLAIGQMRISTGEADETEASEAGETVVHAPDGYPAAPMPEPMLLPPFGRIGRMIIIACLAAFYLPFVSVLRIMGYPWPAVLGFCGFVFLPIPGLLVLAYVDTRIAKTWTNAQKRKEEQEQTRQTT